MKKILFVCTGNTCRSSMAEGIFNTAVAKDHELAERYIAVSAGISAFEGNYASQNSIKVLKDEWDIDIKPHRSKQISKNEINDAYLILTMTKGHKGAILSMFPEAKPKVFTLKEYTGYGSTDQSIDGYNSVLDITDPYGMPIQAYKMCADEIKHSIDILISKLKKEDGQ